MNPRPIIVASIIAVLFVAAVYFSGRFVYEQGHIKDTSPPTVSKPKGHVDNTPAPTENRPNDTPTTDTNNEQQTSVAQQPAPAVDIEVDNTPTEAETPTNTSNQEAPEVHPDWLEYQSISNQLAKIESSRPKREDFQSSIDYTDAWLAWHDSVESESASLQSRQSEILKSYMKTLSPTEILDAVSKLKELVDEDDYGILETHLQDMEVPIETQN